jgi:thymidylate kinase
MINDCNELFSIVLNKLKEDKIEIDKLNDDVSFHSYYVDKSKIDNILQTIFDICSSNKYCFSISREKYAQVNIVLFEQESTNYLALDFFTIMPNKITKSLEEKHNNHVYNRRRLNIIPIIGPDGVGKSTLLDELIPKLEEKVFFKRFKKVVRHSILYNIFHPLNKNSVRKKIGKKSIKNQHDDMHYLLCIIGGLTAYPYLILQSLFKKKIVLLDRFFYDYFFENISLLNKPTNLRKNWKFLLKIIPSTYFLIHLDAEAKTILSRKEELLEDDIIQYRKLSFSLYLEKPSVIYLYINTALEIEQCQNIVLDTGIKAKVFQKSKRLFI